MVVGLAFAACVTPPKPAPTPGDEALLALSPASLGRELHLAQRVTFTRGATSMAIDAQLEADSSSLKLAAFALGQTVAKLSWDGVHLEETHSQRVPEAVTPARIMSDVQLAFWPEDAVRAGLPAGYALQVTPARRLVLHQDAPFIDVRYTGTGPVFPRIQLEHVAHGFTLLIESTEAE
jgi:hypothetical protein